MVTFLCVIGGILVLTVLIAAVKTKKPVRSMLMSGVEGICALAAVNILGAFTGIAVGLNIFTALCCLFLGIPGVITLLVLRIVFGV